MNVADPIYKRLSDAAPLDTHKITDLELLRHEPWSPIHIILS
jgi:hypothetical protein